MNPSSYQQHNTNHRQQQSPTVPAQIKLTDYLRPVFQEAFMVREYCAFTSLQQTGGESSGGGSSGTLPVDDNHGSVNRVISGMYVIPSAQSMYLWFGTLLVSSPASSPWHGGVFRFVIRFPENYPSSMPTITLLPIVHRGSVHSTLSSHPDVSPSTGQFNLRAYYNSTSSSSSTSTTVHHQSKTYKILKCVRKAFTRQFTSSELDPQSCPNPAAAELAKSNHQEFLQKCAAEAEESWKSVDAVDSYLVHKFKRDPNLILLGGGINNNTDNNTTTPQQQHPLEEGGSSHNGVVAPNTTSSTSSSLPPKRGIGLSFL